MSDPLLTRLTVELPVGFQDRAGVLQRTAEVRAATGADEMFIGMSREYNQYPNEMVYKMLLLARCVTRLGEATSVSLADIQALHARDLRAIEYAVYALTYGDDEAEADAPPAEG
jgi:hypothetical protein